MIGYFIIRFVWVMICIYTPVIFRTNYKSFENSTWCHRKQSLLACTKLQMAKTLVIVWLILMIFFGAELFLFLLHLDWFTVPVVSEKSSKLYLSQINVWMEITALLHKLYRLIVCLIIGQKTIPVSGHRSASKSVR